MCRAQREGKLLLLDRETWETRKLAGLLGRGARSGRGAWGKRGGEAGGAGITGCRNGSVGRELGGRQELGDAEGGEWRRRSS